MEIQAPWLRPIVDMVKFILIIEKGSWHPLLWNDSEK